MVKSVAAPRFCVSVSRFTHRWMYHLFGQNHVSPDFVNDIPAGSPSNPFPFALSDVSSFARWLRLLLLRQFRFKNRFFSNFFTMYTMRIFYYIEQWPYSRQHSFPTLNQHLYPAQKYGTNLMDFDHHYSDQTNAFIDAVHVPSPDLAEEEALMDELLEPNLPEPHQHVAAPPPDALPDPSKLSTTASTPAKRKPNAKATPKAPAKRRRRTEQSRSRSSSPLSTWTFEDKQKLRTLKADEKSRFSWRVISTKMGKSEADVRSMWNKIKDRLG